MSSIVLFTKLFHGKSVDEIARVANDLGFDGIDLLVRSGFQVDPHTPAGIAPVVARLKAAGLTIPMATTDITNPDALDVPSLFASLAAAGISVVRLGYWKYDPAVGYDATLALARAQLASLVESAKSAGLQLTIQLHGGTIHASGAQTRAMLDGFDPQWLGAYPDPGNQVVQEGREDWQFTLDVLGPWLKAIGVKNGGWFPSTLRDSGQRAWSSDWLGLSEGMVPWDEILQHLKNSSFAGLYTLHSHYELPYPQVIDQTRSDINFVRSLLT